MISWRLRHQVHPGLDPAVRPPVQRLDDLALGPHEGGAVHQHGPGGQLHESVALALDEARQAPPCAGPGIRDAGALGGGIGADQLGCVRRGRGAHVGDEVGIELPEGEHEALKPV